MSRPADTDSDRELIEAARAAIQRNYDTVHENYTVGAAVRCASGKVYVGVNVYSLHRSCSECITIGAAVTACEREFVALACVRGANGDELLPPCGNCWQMLNDYAPDCEVIVSGESGLMAVIARELLPFAYRVE